MIDVKATILETIKDKFNRLRFLGDNDPKGLKKILALIVLDDLYEWSDYLDAPQAVQKKIQEMRTNYILCQRDFKIEHTPQEGYYINVNTPQTNYTWKRVWDAPDLFPADWDEISVVVGSDLHPRPFTPDPTCPVSLTYFGEGERIPADILGKPLVDFDTLTICEKMNIYINRKTGQMFFLDPDTCTWKALKGELAAAVNWEDIQGAPDIYSSIEHTVVGDDEEKTFDVTLDKATRDEMGNWNYGHQTSSHPVTVESDLSDVL